MTIQSFGMILGLLRFCWLLYCLFLLALTITIQILFRPQTSSTIYVICCCAAAQIQANIFSLIKCSDEWKWMKRTEAANRACVSCWFKSCAHSTRPQNFNWYSSSRRDSVTAFSTVIRFSTHAIVSIGDLIVSTAYMNPCIVASLYDSNCLLMFILVFALIFGWVMSVLFSTSVW